LIRTTSTLSICTGGTGEKTGAHLVDQVWDQLAEFASGALLGGSIGDALEAVVDLWRVRGDRTGPIADLGEIFLHNGSDVVSDVLTHLAERGRESDGRRQSFLGDQHIDLFGDRHLPVRVTRSDPHAKGRDLDLVQLVQERDDRNCAREGVLEVLELPTETETEMRKEQWETKSPHLHRSRHAVLHSWTQIDHQTLPL
jgi:hypothetical protein